MICERSLTSNSNSRTRYSRPITGIEGFKYQASDGYGWGVHTLRIRDFSTMGSPHLTVMYSFPYIRLSEPGAAQARDNSYP